MSPEPISRAGAGKGWRSKNLLWVIPLGLAIIAIMGILALPKLVSSGYHRATIEDLASSLTGRNVHIGGRLSLALLPHPQFIAGDVTITSPNQETVTASSLTLDIAPIPLLRGQVSARSITLQSPRIALPWPLPGGAAAIAPPRWLTALHAQINNGEVSLGAVTFSHVSADIYTGSDGAFSVSGTGDLSGYALGVSLGLGAVSAVGSTPLTLDIQGKDATKLHARISGSFDASSTLSGSAAFSAATLAGLDPSLSQPVTGSADISADPQQITLSKLSLQQGSASLSGSARLELSALLLTLKLSGQNLVVPINPGLMQTAKSSVAALPTHLEIDAGDTRLTGAAGTLLIPHLQSTVDLGPAGATITALAAALSRDSNLRLSGKLDETGNLQAKTAFDSIGLNNFIGALGGELALPPAWQKVKLAGNVRGTLDHLAFENLTGNLGPAHLAGTAILSQQRSLTGALHFDALDLTPIVGLLKNPPNRFSTGNPLDLDFEITADRANIDKVQLTHLLLDAELSNQLVVRRLTATVFNGIAATSFTLSPGPDQATPDNPQTGLISSARAVFALPLAQPAAALLPPWLQPPAALTRAPLALSLSAAGPPDALSTSANLILGAVSITASPSLDLVDQRATGAFTLRHPDAIAAFKAFGLNAGLAWPGAGSIALRANMVVSPVQIGFSDFVLSMGDLTANGKLIYGFDHQLNGQIDADTLALPPLPAGFTLPRAQLAGMQGKIGISANRVLLAGTQILGPVTAALALGASQTDLAISQASLANGILKGDFTASSGNSLPAAKSLPPALTAKFTISGADPSQLNLPLDFPITLPTGSLDAAGDLTASGYAPRAWLATISGSTSLSAHAGTLNGFNLPAASSALIAKSQRMSQLRNACLTGTTPFTQLDITGAFNDGIYTLTKAALQSPAGSASATGSIDLPDQGVSLAATLLANVPAPPQIALTIDGTWTTPRKAPDLTQAQAWQPPHP